MRVSNLRLFLTLFVLTLLSYFYVLDNDFLGDDYVWIFTNEELHSLWATVTGKLRDRPLLMALMWLERSVFGLQPVGFRAVNVLLHAVTGYQLFLLMRDLNGSTSHDWKLPFLVALGFSLHPLHSQALYIVIQCAVIITGLCSILSLRALLRWLNGEGERQRWIAVGWILFGILFKPNLSFIPLFYFVVIRLLYPNAPRKRYLQLWPFFAVLAIPVFYYTVLKMHNQDQSLSSWNYLLVQCEVLLTYFRLMLLPLGLRYLYDFRPPVGLDYHYLLLALHVAVIVAGLKLLKEPRKRLFFIGFYLSFLPESSFFPIRHLAFEHRTYFGLIFLALLVNQFTYTSSFSRNVRAVGVLFCASYVVLNQVRMFQVKPVANWYLHTIEHSQSQPDYAVNFFLNLSRMNQPAYLAPLVEKLRAHDPDSEEYKALELVSQLELGAPDRLVKLKALGTLLVTQKMMLRARLDLCNYMIRQLYKDYSSRAELMILETTLAHQVESFDYNEIVVPLKNFYEVFAQDLIAAAPTSPEPFPPEWLLRIKAILMLYYGKNFPGLEDEIRSAFAKDQKNNFVVESMMILNRRAKTRMIFPASDG